MKKPKVKLYISLLNDGGVLIVTRADAELGALHDCLDVWDDDRDSARAMRANICSRSSGGRSACTAGTTTTWLC
jgi:hypothetical protein